MTTLIPVASIVAACIYRGARTNSEEKVMVERVTVVEQAMVGFDYNAEAELFSSPNRNFRRPIGYRRFARAADAIRFAIEELPPKFLLGACLEVDGERYDSGGIRRLYGSMDYPLIRGMAT